MPDNLIERESSDQAVNDLSRRDFVALGLAAGFVAATVPAGAAELPVAEADVTIKTPDGTCDAVFIHPTTGTHPGVIV